MKNIILKSVTAIAVTLTILSMTLIDSSSFIPSITCIICLGWLLIFGYANKERI